MESREVEWWFMKIKIYFFKFFFYGKIMICLYAYGNNPLRPGT